MIAPVVRTALVRTGTIPEVLRCHIETDAILDRGALVVVRTHRGLQLGTFLEEIQAVGSNSLDEPPATAVLRPATADDRTAAQRFRAEVEREFPRWSDRIRQWRLQLELIDLERTLDGEKLVLYVLNERGPECTKLALQAAAAGLGVVEVQPVGAEGLMQISGGGGCGSGGCGSGGCGH